MIRRAGLDEKPHRTVRAAQTPRVRIYRARQPGCVCDRRRHWRDRACGKLWPQGHRQESRAHGTRRHQICLAHPNVYGSSSRRRGQRCRYEWVAAQGRPSPIFRSGLLPRVGTQLGQQCREGCGQLPIYGRDLFVRRRISQRPGCACAGQHGIVRREFDLPPPRQVTNRRQGSASRVSLGAAANG